mmetsp:Transcript_81341/g.220578  ORF Transcript_81341/g.220578 Transcript_81341/m.220578 type:complete len:158 (+) Transcript_81341:85-558(+)
MRPPNHLPPTDLLLLTLMTRPAVVFIFLCHEVRGGDPVHNIPRRQIRHRRRLAIPGVCGVPFVDRGVKFVDLCSMAAPRCRTRPTAVYRRYLSAAPPWQRMPATRAGACAFGAGPGLGVPAPARADLLHNLGVRRQAFSGLTGETAVGDPAGSLSHP